jgi:deoxycytidylate deaminase
VTQQNNSTPNSTAEPAPSSGSVSDDLPYSKDPELIFGLVGPIGVDLEYVTEVLSEALRLVSYETHTFRITELMREVSTGLPLDASGYIDSIKQRIAYANKVRELLNRNDALAILAVSAIREFRNEITGDPEEPLPKHAYVLRQFKRPEEVKLLRSVYGKQFIQISIHAPQDYRTRRITVKEVYSRRGLVTNLEAENAAHALVKQDEMESNDGYGQNVRDAFPLADVFIEAPDKVSCKITIERFVKALFGDNSASPTHDEYGMYMAKSASLRSSALGRQVGAAIFRDTGEIISLGCNEVPKARGGTYWSGDEGDARDIVIGTDPNDQKKAELLVDLVNRLLKGKHLSESLADLQDAAAIAEAMLEEEGGDAVKESKMMDLLEFGRDIHAEMSAISDAARNGLSVKDAILYSTTFPCHICAKHIIAVGIKKVIYIEPYPKSYAEELHSDAIHIEGDGKDGKVGFRRFIGISPFRYRDLFEKGKRKYSGGGVQKWNRDEMRPMIEVLFPSYAQSETHVVNLLQGKIDALNP